MTEYVSSQTSSSVCVDLELGRATMNILLDIRCSLLWFGLKLVSALDGRDVSATVMVGFDVEALLISSVISALVGCMVV